MKDYEQYHLQRFSGERQRFHDELRGIAKIASDEATKPYKLIKLIESMPERCEVVLPAEGGPIKSLIYL